MDLHTQLKHLPGIGNYLSFKLSRLNLFTVEDLVYHFPFRYDDFSKIASVSEIKEGNMATIKGEIWSIKNVSTRSRKVLTTAILNDGTNTIELIWFNQPWLTKSIHTGDYLQVSGKIKRIGSKINIIVPVWEKVEKGNPNISQESSLHTGRLVPVYPETDGLTSKWIRAKISQILPLVLPIILDPITPDIKKFDLNLAEALKEIHFPKDYKAVEKATEKLRFDELFYIQLQTQKRRLDWEQKKLIEPLKIDTDKVEKFIKNLPFPLTSAQQRVIKEILADLQKEIPMNRLVQGDVGSGKTVVAAVIIYIVTQNNLRALLMAPTEILAFQHHKTLSNLLNPFGIEVGIYTGSRKFSKLAVSNKLKATSQSPNKLNASPDVIVGTHALLSEKFTLDDVGLVVVDEQQRFGVEQRAVLRGKAKTPNFLTMTATPIPRTVALTLYGDLNLSVIDELPPGRKTIKTHFVPERKRKDAYSFIEKQIREGRQIYIITPLIEESETSQSAKAAKVEYERLKSTVFKNHKLGLLHGKLKPQEKEVVLNAFKNHEIDILVSTSVVEVGVDVPNATIMLIEGSEKFGLAQLHQFRGRVGRAEHQSYTFLFTENENPQIVNRVKNLEKINDGLKLSELDLKIRGSGEIFGIRQSGDWNLKIASLSDLRLIEETRNLALKILTYSPKLDNYPLLLAKLSNFSQDVSPD